MVLSVSPHQQYAYTDTPFLTYEKAIVLDVDSSLFKAILFGGEQIWIMRQPVDAQADLIAFCSISIESRTVNSLPWPSPLLFTVTVPP